MLCGIRAVTLLLTLSGLHGLFIQSPGLDLVSELLDSRSLLPGGSFQKAQNCWDLLQAHYGGSCSQHGSHNPGVLTFHCRSHENKGLVVLRSLAAKDSGQEVYRIRLTGSTVELLGISYCSKHLAIAPYHLRTAGTYTIEILHLHSNYSIHDPSPVHARADLHASTFQVQAHLLPANHPVNEHASICKDLDSSGKWEISQIGLNLSSTCVHEDYRAGCFALELVTGINKSGLSWRQHDCRMHILTAAEAQHCLKMRRVCLYGDSHMRSLYTAVLKIVEPGITDELGEKILRPSSILEYIEDHWGFESLEADIDCDVILANTGAWHVSYEIQRQNASRTKPDLLEYAARVTAMAVSLRQAKLQGIEAIWMTTNGQPVNLAAHGHERYENKDFRTEPMLLTLNRIANAAMLAENIPIFDTWGMTNPIADTAYDGAHFAGDVAHTIAQRFLGGICQRVGDTP